MSTPAVGLCISLLATLALAAASPAATGTGAASTDVLLDGEPRPAGATPRPAFGNAAREAERAAMVDAQIAGRGVQDIATLEAIRTVPRHRFVPDDQQSAAYLDRPLPIGHGQTISQPYIVGLMTELLDLEPDDRVLEVGTGSAYQAAILARLAARVVTVEIIRPLAENAAARLKAMGFTNVTVLHGDGYYGWGEHAPYQAIIVTAAASHVPPPLVEQLEPGGRMVIPVGRSAWTQNLLLVEKADDGSITTRNLMPVRFVPLTGEH